jgi:aminobenzoyl-glutamate utilization protein B
VHVAKVMAATACKALTDPALRAAAKADHAARTARHPYRCPIPQEIAPPLDMAGVGVGDYSAR